MSSPAAVCIPHTVVINLPTGKTITAQVPNNVNATCELKRIIFQHTNIPPIQQRLNIPSGTDAVSFPLTVSVTQRKQRVENIPIVVKTFSEVNVEGVNTFNLKIDVNDTILDVKFLLFSKLQVLPDNQRLYIRVPGQPTRQHLHDGVVLSALNIQGVPQLNISFELPSQQKGHGTIHRTSAQLKEFENPNVRTLGANFLQACSQFPKRRFLGTRSFLKNGERGDYEWATYEQIAVRVLNTCSGLKQLGLKPQESLGIVGANRTEWIIADMACNTQGFISVPLYDTLGADAIEFIINHASVRIVVASFKELKALASVRSKCPTLEHVILMNDWGVGPKELEAAKGMYSFTLTELEKLGADNKAKFVASPPSPNDIMTICYTSGTTGNPKGVMCTHANMVAAISAINDRTPPDERTDSECVLSYLPLAHIYERVVEAAMVSNGYAIGFGQGDTTKLVEDVAALKPTMFPGVPRVWQRIFDRINAQVAESGYIKSSLFARGFSTKIDKLHRGDLSPTFWDKIVFSKMAEKFGGRVKLMVSGAAPLSSKVAEFMRTCFNTHFIEGYGLTETCAALTCALRDDCTHGHVGLPTACCEVKLVDVPDMEYLVTDQPFPRGEIWVRGPNIFKGYFKQQDITDEVIDKDGWFATGDVGTWLPDGSLKIIDRKKNLFKLSQGEYIRPEHIEGVYKQSTAVANIFVHGDSNENYLVGVVFPDVDALKQFATANGVKGSSVADMIKDPKVVAWVDSSMEAVGKREKLRGFEFVKRFVLVGEDFSVDNGLLTPTFKLKRNVAAKYFAKQIAEMYKLGEPKEGKPQQQQLQSKL